MTSGSAKAPAAMTAIRFCPRSLTSRLSQSLGVVRGQPPHGHLRGPFGEGPTGLGDILEVGHGILVAVEQGVRPRGPEPQVGSFALRLARR